MLVASAVVFTAHLGFADGPVEGGDLAEMSLEELMNIEVYSVSKKAGRHCTIPLQRSTC